MMLISIRSPSDDMLNDFELRYGGFSNVLDHLKAVHKLLSPKTAVIIAVWNVRSRLEHENM